MFVTTTLAQTTTQTCKSQNFTNNEIFTSCRDLPQLTSYLHWTYDQTTGKLDIAFRHKGITDTNRWVAWAINRNNDLTSSMNGAQALVAIPQSSGTPKAYTSSIAGSGTQLAESNISYPHSRLSATHENNEVTIYASITLPVGTTSLVHLWQDGAMSGSTPQMHDMTSANTQSKESLDLRSGASEQGSGGGSLSRRRNVSNSFSFLIFCFFVLYIISPSIKGSIVFILFFILFYKITTIIFQCHNQSFKDL